MKKKDEYDEIIDIINGYSSLPEVISNKNIISAYDLKEILKEDFSRFGSVDDDKTILKKSINDFLLKNPSNLVDGGLNFIKNVIPRKNFKGECLEVSLYNSDDKNIIRFEIFIEYKRYELRTKVEYFKISKNKDSKFISIDKYPSDGSYYPSRYFVDNSVYKDFVNKNEEMLMNVFNKMEEEKRIFDLKQCKDTFTQVLGDENFLVDFSFSSKDNFVCSYGLKDEKLRKETDREWGGRQTLREILNEKEDYILKRIPINVKDLEKAYKNIVENYFSEDEYEDNKVKCENNKYDFVNSVDDFKDINSEVFNLVDKIRDEYEDVLELSNGKIDEDINRLYIEFLYNVIEFNNKGINIKSKDLEKVNYSARCFKSVIEQKRILPKGKVVNTSSGVKVIDGNLYVSTKESNNKRKVLF